MPNFSRGPKLEQLFLTIFSFVASCRILCSLLVVLYLEKYFALAGLLELCRLVLLTENDTYKGTVASQTYRLKYGTWPPYSYLALLYWQSVESLRQSSGWLSSAVRHSLNWVTRWSGKNDVWIAPTLTKLLVSVLAACLASVWGLSMLRGRLTPRGREKWHPSPTENDGSSSLPSPGNLRSLDLSLLSRPVRPLLLRLLW